MLTALRRKFRLGMQRTVLIAVLLAVGLFSYAFLNLSFCFKLMSHRSLTHMVSTSAAESQHTHTLTKRCICIAVSEVRTPRVQWIPLRGTVRQPVQL